MDPMEIVQDWLADARRAEVPGADTMVVATATPDGRPSARAVILRGLDHRGFVFFTDTRSRKGRELSANPHAAVVLVWDELQKQVRAEGPVERVPAAESDAYFASRPRGHQLASWVSRQSEVLARREDLERLMVEVTGRFGGRDVPRPPYWGGYRLIPHAVELWEGRPDRLHDRVRYHRASPEADWLSERLWP